eukprot:TRINITY_DN10344_c0_g1_i8.p1 TRINITY_DN10344_c0_g1~~TRINITY_DN10344_c0_g1_i8.p1  ORF type:complete len:137 (+),score=21.83 TRINITY_DN10344_c0_g1_i8:186-596(+)
MAQCFKGVRIFAGNAQRRQVAVCGDACAEISAACSLEKDGMLASDNVEGTKTPESSSTRASTPEASPVRKRDVIRQKIFGGHQTPASGSEASFASTALRTRKRDWILVKLGMKKQVDVLEQDALEEEGKDVPSGPH